MLLNGQKKEFASAEKIEVRQKCRHAGCSGTEQCSTQAHTITTQILPDGLPAMPGRVELVALRSSTLFFSALIGEALKDFSVLTKFFIRNSREFGSLSFADAQDSAASSISCARFPAYCTLAASLIFVACHATACHRPLRRRNVPVLR